MPSAVSSLTPEHRYWRWNILLATYGGYAGYYLCRKVFSSVKPVLHETLSLDYNRLADIWTAFLVAYMLGQFMTTFLGRRFSAKVLLVSGLGMSILVNAIFGFANNYWTFLVFMVFNGFLQATGWPASVGAVAHWIRPEERGLIMGIWSTSHVVGTMIVKGSAGYLLALAGWRWSFWGASVVAFLFWLILAWRHHDRPEDVGLSPLVADRPGEENDIREKKDTDGQGEIGFSEYLKIIFHPVVLTMGMAYLGVKFLRYAMDSWIPTFLVVLGLDASNASYYSAIFDVCGIFPAVIAGWALDRIFRGNWALLSMTAAVGMAAGFFIAAFYPVSPLAVALSFGLIGFMIYGPETILSGAASVQVAGEKNGLAIAGVVNGLGSIGPIIQEKVIGWLMQHDPSGGMRNVNILGMGISVTLVLFMGITVWRGARVRK
ncbi:MAG TPA: MFS transporter [Candidatus Hydrogenedentes bacterium]|mgnify:CR=1 FL=1|nr:MFS transporter [Candidatus Hydrogenedentota bacterium]